MFYKLLNDRAKRVREPIGHQHEITIIFYFWEVQRASLGSAGKESTCSAGDLDLIPELGRSPGEGNGYPLQYSGLRIFHGLYHPWGCNELDITLHLDIHFTFRGHKPGLHGHVKLSHYIEILK